MKWVIYKHTNKINGKSYIGQTKQKEKARWQYGNGYSHNKYFYNAIKKYGWDLFEHEIIEKDIFTQESANEREIYWIGYFDSFNNGYNLTKGGDNHEHLGIPVLQIDTKTLEIVNVFLTVRQAEESTKIDHSQISRCCYLDKKGVTAGGYYWCFQDGWYKGWSPKKRRIPNMPKKAIYQIDKKLGIVAKFSSGLEAEFSTGIPASRISCVCNHKSYITAGGYYWCFQEEWCENWKPDLPKDEKPVVRILKTNFKDIKIYSMISLAAKDNGIKCSEAISRACKGLTISAGNYYWCYLSDYNEFWSPRQDSNKSRIICIETGVVYNSIQEAIDETNGSRNISRACQDSGLTSGGFHWMYYEEFLKKGWCKREKKQGAQRKVYCVETKEVFDTISQAAKEKNVDGSGIVKCCKNPSKTTKGLHWAYLEEFNDSWKAIPQKVGRHGMKKVFCEELNKSFDCINEAKKETGVDASSIIRCCKGKQQIAGGYHWKYIEE